MLHSLLTERRRAMVVMAGNLATSCLHRKAVPAGTGLRVCKAVFALVIVFKMDGLPFLPGNNFTNPTVSM